jgi:predicted nucleotidyltransferase
MTNISKQTYRELSFPYFREVFLILDKVCRDLGIGYYLIGAQARDFHLLESGIAPIRGTMDIDFAVMLPEMKQYDEMKNHLIKMGFRVHKQPYRLGHEITDTMIDLLPFGEVEEEGTVKFTDRKTELSVIGMKEVSEYAIEVQMEELSIKVSPLEGLVILKLISYSDKPERRKDLDDINEMLRNYYVINEERFFAELLHVIEELPDNNYIQLAGARLMGRDMKKILIQSEKLSKRIEAIIQNELKEDAGSMTRYFLSQNYFNDYELVKNIFAQLLKGITE